MDKKNTMLLTVIAVATLLVAVVGATFAYFTAQTTNTGTTATVTGTTGTVSTVALSSTHKELEIKTTASDFAKHDNAEGISFYADVVGNNYAEAAKNHILGAVSITGEGTFNCLYEVTVSAENVPAGMLPADGKVVVTGNGISNGTLNISDLGTEQKLNGSWTGLTKDTTPAAMITIDAYLVNTDAEQDYLQTANIELNFSIEKFECTNVAAAE